MSKLNSGIIYTNQNCIGCNKCISGCPVLAANVIVFDDRTQTHSVQVDGDKCILCGRCIKVCMHKARIYRDDTDRFFGDLDSGQKISVIIAPSFLCNYSKEYNNILGYMRHMGINHIYSASFGADITTWAYLNYIEANYCSGMMSGSCPPVVSYIEQNHPELIDKIIPIQSSVICTAIYVKKYLGITDKLAIIVPCISKKREIEDPNTGGCVDYSLTFSRFMSRLSNIDMSDYYSTDELPYGLGALYSMSGGLTKNAELYIGFDKVIVQTHGIAASFPYVDHYNINDKHLPYLIEIMSCTNGCNFGTATDCGVELSNEISFSAHNSKEQAYNNGNVPKANNNHDRLIQLNERFSSFRLRDFMREFNRFAYCPPDEMTEEEINNTFADMFKFTHAEKNKDCGSCGYKSCLDMVHAIHMNLNKKENCIDYSKECIRRENDKINLLMRNISAMNVELKASAQMKSDFLANMSHEIRTPMNAVIGMTEIALRGNLPDKERSYIQQIHSSGKSLLTIINDILDFSKIESGKMQLVETNYELMSIVNDCTNILLTRIGEKSVKLLYDIDPSVPHRLYGDEGRIKQVLLNIANNAVKFTQKGSILIKIFYENIDSDNILIKFSVTDTGIGIKEEDTEKLFHSFQQVDSKRNRNIEGTGLGLAISKQLVELMNGKISVESTYGKGSCFSFEIPQKVIDSRGTALIKDQKPHMAAVMLEDKLVTDNLRVNLAHFGIDMIECATLEQIEEASFKGADYAFISRYFYSNDTLEFAKSGLIKCVLVTDRLKYISDNFTEIRDIPLPLFCLNLAAVFNNEDASVRSVQHSELNIKFIAPEAEVLIVDDNAINLTVAQGLLNPLQMKITTACSAADAIEKIKEHKFDLIFMDHMMPVTDGVEATHMIRELDGDYFRNVPIIALTANAMSGAKDMFLKEGMNDFVAKPIEMPDITRKIHRWLPQNKIIDCDPAAAAAKNSESIKIDGLDTEAAISLTGSKELYLKVLGDYYAAIDEKSDKIERLLQSDDIKNYTIEVHALKSSSKLIGATELSEKAAMLEKCGHENESVIIFAQTPSLLQMYRGLKAVIEPFVVKTDEKKTAEITAEELVDILEQLYEKVEDFDIDGINAIIERLKGCKLDNENSGFFEKLCAAAKSVDYDAAEKAVNGWYALYA